MGELTPNQKWRRQRMYFSWTAALLLIGSVVFANFIASYLPVRLDTSQGRVYSISSGTKSLLKKIEDRLLIRVVFSSKLPPPYKLNEQYVRDLLSEYKRASNGKIWIEYLDPSESQKARQDAVSAGVAPVQMDVRERDRREVKECFMGLSFMYGDKLEAIPVIEDTQGLEYEITQRIKRLVFPEKPSLGFVKNGESLTLASPSLEALRRPMEELYTVQEVDLKQPIPAGLKSLWLVGPTKELEPDIVDKLRTWVREGGTLGLLLDRYDIKLDQFRASGFKNGLDPLLSEWGVQQKDGLVFDPQSDRVQIRSVQGIFQMIHLVDYPYFPWVSDLDRTHPATKGIDGIVLSFVSPFEVIQEAPGLSYRPLAKSSKMSWLDKTPFYISPLERKTKPADVSAGPLSLALLIEGQSNPDAKPGEKPMGRVILFGTSRFIRSDFPPNQNNYAVFLNMLDWSAQDEVLLSIRAKGVSRRPIREFSDGIRLLIKYLLVLALPVLSVLLGLWIWRRQKTRRALLPLRYQGA